MASTTIAFSTKGQAWTTRYSFIPTCYGTIDNHLISCKTKVDESTTEPFKSFWNHVEQSNNPKGNNTFYDVTYPTSVTVSANKSPSGNKIFKALSLETNVDKWSFTFITDKDYDANENQFAFLKPTQMAVREGNRYINIPRSQTWSSNNTVYVGEAVSFSLYSSPNSMYTAIHMQKAPISPVMFSENSILTTYRSGQLMAFDATNGVMAPISEVTNPILVVNYNEETGDLILNTDTALSVSSLSCFITTPSIIDGDFLRGKSCLITMSCSPPNIASKPKLELYSIGVEYEFSNLDSRLG